MAVTPPQAQEYFVLHCDSPGTRLSTARGEGHCNWPFRKFPTTATPRQVADTFRSYLRSHPGIDHIVFTATGRPSSRPYLQAHLVDGCIHVQVAPLHTADSHTRAIVHRLNTTITDAFKRRSTTIEVTTDIAGLGRWARAVLAQEQPPDSTNARIARIVLGLLKGDRTDAPDTNG